MNTMIRIAFLTALCAMVASCEFFKENDLLEDVKKDPPVAGADTDAIDKDDVTPDVDNTATCGNGEVAGSEECDSSSGTTSKPCTQIDGTLYGGGDATCDANCLWDKSGCILKNCGDGTVQPDTEDCDVSLSDTKPCTDINGEIYNGGDATCGADCKWKTTDCVLKTCGNGTVDTGEDCEGDMDIDCVELDPLQQGIAPCNPETCKWDLVECQIKPVCGNGTVDANETCEKTQSKPCIEVNQNMYSDGTALCNGNCDGWVTTNCQPKSTCTCGNGIVDADPANNGACPGYEEACETNQTSDCEAQGYPDAGSTTVNCKTDCTGWDVSVCLNDTDTIPDDDTVTPVCGNGTIEGTESCDDGNALNGTYGHCNTICTEMGPHCGDNNTDSGYETCDDGNQTPGDGCSSNCKFDDSGCDEITAGAFTAQTADDGMGGNIVMFVAEFTPTEGSGILPELFFVHVDDDFIPVKDQTYQISEATKDDYGLQAMTDYDGMNGTQDKIFTAYAGQMRFTDYDLDGSNKFTDSAWGQVDAIYFGEVDGSGNWIIGGQCRHLAQASWDLIKYPVITDLTASYSGTVNTVQIQWTAPQNASRYNQYRICVDTACNDVAAGMSPGGTEIQTVTVPWYSGTHSISVQPLRDGNPAAISTSIQVDTNGHAELAPVSGIDFGLVGYNSYLDRAVTINNTSTLVDLVINETTLPMDCTGKVTILSGNVTPASQMTVDPGAFHAATLRYAPTETSQCTDGQVRVQWVVTDDGLGNKTYEEANLPVSGSSANTPPVITATSASVNPAKNSNGTIRLFINVMDENTILLSEFDGIQGVGDFREVGGGVRESLGNTTYGTGDNHWYWWRDIDVSTLGNGIYVIPITVTDSAGHIAKTNATFAIYSGNMLEVGDGKTFTAIKDAVNAAGNYDVIVVHPGTYTGTGNSNINPGSKTISIYGIAGPDDTIIDATGMLDPTFVVDQDNGNLYIGGLALLNNPGGAVWLGAATNNQKVSLTDFRIEGNSNSINGGALTAANDKVDLTITHGVFHNNSATGAAGGAVYASAGAKMFFVDVLFDDNTAQIGGAVATNAAGPITFDRCVFTSNEGTVQGGALNFVSANGSIEMRNCIVAQNTSGGHGGGLFIDDSVALPVNLKIYNSTIVENVATYDGGGINMIKGSFEMKDSILFFNQAGAGLTTQLLIYDDGSGPPEVSAAVVQNCAIGGGANPISDAGTRINAPNGFVSGQQGNIIDDPLFVGGTTGGVMRFRLSAASPCIDTGSDGSTVPTYDFLGYSRYNVAGKGDGTGAEADMGAFEYQP